MRLKTLGVIILTAMAVGIMLFWLTDGLRRTAIAHEQEEELLEFGAIIFSEDDTEPAAAGCALRLSRQGGGVPGPAARPTRRRGRGPRR